MVPTWFCYISDIRYLKSSFVKSGITCLDARVAVCSLSEETNKMSAQEQKVHLKKNPHLQLCCMFGGGGGKGGIK